MTEWQEKVVRILLDAGAKGVQHNLLAGKVDWHVETLELVDYLEYLRREGGVQRFRDGRTTYWRATELLPSIV